MTVGKDAWRQCAGEVRARLGGAGDVGGGGSSQGGGGGSGEDGGGSSGGDTSGSPLAPADAFGAALQLIVRDLRAGCADFLQSGPCDACGQYMSLLQRSAAG